MLELGCGAGLPGIYCFKNRATGKEKRKIVNLNYKRLTNRFTFWEFDMHCGSFLDLENYKPQNMYMTLIRTSTNG